MLVADWSCWCYVGWACSLCWERWSERLNVRRQMSQTKGRSPVCLRIWRVNSSRREKLQPHHEYVQECGFSPDTQTADRHTRDQQWQVKNACQVVKEPLVRASLVERRYTSTWLYLFTAVSLTWIKPRSRICGTVRTNVLRVFVLDRITLVQRLTFINEIMNSWIT